MLHHKKVKILYDTLDFSLSVIRLFTLTHFKKTCRIKKNHERCILMGNGPSLIQSMEDNKESLHDVDIIAVNNMALSAEYVKYKPDVYILCDGSYWFEATLDPGKSFDSFKNDVIEFYQQLVDKTTWTLQLYIPYKAKKEAVIKEILSQNANIRLHYYNKTRFEGCKRINYFIYSKQWGMPRAQNILLASLMLLIYSQYKEIYLAGADSDWMKSIWVDEQNKVRLDDFHYYNTDGEKRILPTKMYEQCASFYITFKNYIDISAFAQIMNVKIINLNPLSFIDAFEKRKKL
ncbi:MAG: hypothetical protein LBG92_06890 [Prevotellaceae bacterium]|nr:hypothetical protein [Prevotellaceae bacterium]